MEKFVNRIRKIDNSRALNKNVYGLWVGQKLSTLEHLSIQSYIQNEHKIIAYVYDDVEGFPKEVDIRSGRDILPEQEIDSIKEKVSKSKKVSIPEDHLNRISLGFFSDLFKYTLLFKTGGWWTDFDAICLKPFDFEDSFVFGRFNDYSVVPSKTVAAGVFKVPPDSGLMKGCFNACKKLLRFEEGVFRTGPRTLTNGISTLKLWSFVKGKDLFCPIAFKELHNLVENTSIPESSYSVHFYSSSFKTIYDPNSQYDKNSLYERLKRRYL
jgi:hypothetical protein